MTRGFASRCASDGFGPIQLPENVVLEHLQAGAIIEVLVHQGHRCQSHLLYHISVFCLLPCVHFADWIAELVSTRPA